MVCIYVFVIILIAACYLITVIVDWVIPTEYEKYVV